MKVTIMLTLLIGLLFGGKGNSAEHPEDYSLMRHEMVDRQIISRGVRDERVIASMDKVPRHLFMPAANRGEAYEDRPVPIGQGQTISQPYIVAYMTEALRLKPDDRVLEIGTGSGYQAAVLAEIVSEVYTIEILPDLAMKAQHVLEEVLGYTNIHFRVGDGYLGWPEQAPYDAIIVTAAPEEIPPALVEQLAEGGRIIAPVGGQWEAQYLILGVKENCEMKTTNLLGVRFVPMVPKR